MELQGKTALVTGATAGIGRDIARTLAGAGARVVVTGRDPERGAETAAAIEAEGGTAGFVVADLGDLDSLRALADEVGEVDILVNNAGIFPFAPAIEQDVATYEQLFAVNVRAPFFLTAALVPKMAAKGEGVIVNVSSIAASIAVPDSSVYSATKVKL
ncbi:SDR family NAD(P)-dependent oxidoreductase [Actinokineospora iranica]|uniref:Short chain dehydrogenase n=1 Tax=Actinokineospora iranica TaxID=1271860 RepID=A0A1G6K1I7_9PSEU|nr:SDR family oxidoreductase [Actinokineospora iranica]SDC24892.1 short chain dehydrogenase [Actinokineospora iranica]